MGADRRHRAKLIRWFRVVVRSMSLLLEVDEHCGQLSCLVGEIPHVVRVFQAPPRKHVVRPSVDLSPRISGQAVGGVANQHFGATFRQTVEDRVVRRADSPAKVRFPWLRAGNLRQVLRRCNEIERFHVRNGSYAVDARDIKFSHSFFSMNEGLGNSSISFSIICGLMRRINPDIHSGSSWL